MDCESGGTFGEVFDTARGQIASGDPVAALQTLLNLLQLTGGVDAALPALQRVQDALAGQAGSTANATKELSNLLAGLSLQPETENSKAAGPAALGGQNASSGVVSSMHHTPEDRRQLQQQALLQAETAASVADGSSRQCPRCSGIISQARWQEHLDFWCCS
ncbi:hypothetical protein WJX84_012369 [Apatococcus fuscideae]|uniref:C2HC zinc finger plants domain-containing protein n=1 Tax=Apatococcus fuscideae TaxID=2026836 RepID=A0AAW1T3Q9_9CHLO